MGMIHDTKDKSFDVGKREVWEAYKRVKANRGAAGVDEVSLEMFDADLERNLYRIWNRMASGSYFPLIASKTKQATSESEKLWHYKRWTVKIALKAQEGG